MDAKRAGKILASLRTDRGLTKRKVARDTGCSYASICAYEYGTRMPCDDVKVKLANYYGVPVESIFYTEANYEKQ